MNSMTIEEARRILGTEGDTMSDNELLIVIDALEGLAHEAINASMQKRSQDTENEVE